MKRSWNPHWVPVLVLLGLLALAASAGAATVSASLDRDTITLGESAALSLTFTGGQPEKTPMPGPIPNLQITDAGQSSEFKFIYGQTTSSVTHSFIVTPSQPGEYKLPAVTAEVGGERLTTQPLVLKVLKPGAPPPEAVNSGTQAAFARLIMPKKQVFAGETVVAQLQIFINNRIQRYGQPTLTAFPADGFNVGGKFALGQPRSMQVGNAGYTVIPVDVALKAIKTGPVSVGPVTLSLVVELPSTSRQRDIFDPFGMFGGGEQRKVTIAAEAVALQSVPLPRENVPPRFNGAVGTYRLSASAGPTNVAVGDPITLKVQLAGRGSLDTLELPPQNTWTNFRAYPATSKVDFNDQLGIQGTKSFEQVLVPQSTDVREVPGFAFVFFNPDTARYESVSQPATPLIVRPAGAAAAPVVARKEADAPRAQDIVHIKPRIGTLGRIGPPLALQPWFVAVQGVPVLAFVLAAAWRRRTDALANNPRLRRRRLVEQTVQDGLRQLHTHAAAKDSEKFFATLFHLLQEQLGERLDVPATAITEAVIEERLKPAGVPEPTLEALRELFQACNLARYAPVRSSQELSGMIPQIENALRLAREVKI